MKTFLFGVLVFFISLSVFAGENFLSPFSPICFKKMEKCVFVKKNINKLVNYEYQLHAKCSFSQEELDECPVVLSTSLTIID